MEQVDLLLQHSANGTSLDLYQTSGTFVEDEQLIVNGVDVSLTVSSLKVYGIRDIKSVAQTALVFQYFRQILFSVKNKLMELVKQTL